MSSKSAWDFEQQALDAIDDLQPTGDLVADTLLLDQVLLGGQMAPLKPNEKECKTLVRWALEASELFGFTEVGTFEHNRQVFKVAALQRFLAFYS